VGWIPLGHDIALEQEIIAQLQSRFGMTPPLPGAIGPPSTIAAPELVPAPGVVPPPQEMPITPAPPASAPLVPPDSY
jgi:hypothetical protein